MKKYWDDKKIILFSIIIPTFNRSHFIGKVVSSFLNQSYPYFELIIVDDGSSDNTKEVIDAIKDIRIKYQVINNAERGAARNFGAKLAKGEYINYFDSDDIAYSNHLEEAYKAISVLGMPMVFHLGYEIKDENDRMIHRQKNLKTTPNKALLKVNYINPNPVFVNNATLGEVMYNTDRGLAGTEDWLYHLQLAARYDITGFHECVTCCMVQHNTRSMNQYSGNDVLKRNRLLQKYLSDDLNFKMKYGDSLHFVSAEMLGLAALHFVLEKKKMNAFKYLLLSFYYSPMLIFNRRTLAIIKHSLI